MIKKIIVFMLSLLMIGCSSNDSIESIQFNEYYKIQSNLIKQNRFVKPNDFDVQLIYNQIDNQYRYDVVINNPTTEMKDIKAMCYVDNRYEDMFPNVGIFEDDSYNLKKDYINKDENYYKGIMLSGTVANRGNAKLYIKYKNDKNKIIELYVEVNDAIR